MNSYTLLDILDSSIKYLKEDEEVTVGLGGIKIPRIQRDYAQGREDEENIRSRFLKALFNHLVSEDSIMDLDFMYGSLKEFNNQFFFTPLDGQQRLTTLFLLNWYVATKELDLEKSYLYKQKLANFSYETRPAAKNFCKELVQFNFSTNPVAGIKNETWFLDFYNQDPTISSMLNMLGAIDVLYRQYNTKLIDRLPTLRFYIMPLDGFNLSDELYIKMNARGKQLSDFENFKADLISWMKSEKNVDAVEFNRIGKYHSQEIPYYLTIASKLDNEWSEIFWSTRNQIHYDEGYFAFITRFIVTHYASVSTKSNFDTAESLIFKSFTKLKNNKLDYRYIGFELFEPLINLDLLRKLEKVLDILNENKNVVNEFIFPQWDKESSWKLYSLEIIPRQYALFYGVIGYLENGAFDEIKFKDWVRVLWNIVIDPTIRTFAATISTIKNVINPLKEFVGDINESLLTPTLYAKLDGLIYNNNYEQSILFQEIEKAKKIKLDIGFKKIIYKLESHPMFKGHISFLLNANSVEDALSLETASTKFSVNEHGNLGKPDNYNWLRAVLILNDDLKGYLENGETLTLLDGSFEQWNRLVNNELRTGFYKLLLKIIENNGDAINNIISDFSFDYDKLWLWNLTKENINNDGKQYSLIDYSESKNVKLYQGEIYFFNKTIWTDSNILLSTFRNQIISSFLLNQRYHHNSNWHNIDNKFFRGANPSIYFLYNDVKVSLIFKSKEMWIGIVKNEAEFVDHLNIPWLNGENIEDNIYDKCVFEFSDLKSLDEVHKKVSSINSYIVEKYKI